MDELALFKQSLGQGQVFELIDHAFLDDLRLAAGQRSSHYSLLVRLVDDR